MVDIPTLTKITTLALADSVNPCELAILAMVLVSIMTHNPDKKKKVLYAGFAFSSAVFIGYMVYGLIIVQFFNSFAEFIRINSSLIYNGLAILSMVIGALNIKDYFMYKPGGIATEMPIWMRPKVKKIIQKMISPSGAFFIGFVVTLFLLPCTMGPYLVASGLLADLGISGAVPWLVYYNIIFVMPMIIIVFLVYFGLAKVEEVSGWRERNIRRLHLIAGTLLFLVGLAILMRWI